MPPDRAQGVCLGSREPCTWPRVAADAVTAPQGTAHPGAGCSATRKRRMTAGQQLVPLEDAERREALGAASDVRSVSDSDVEISRLAGLRIIEYERERIHAAERLDIRTPILDRLVAAERAKSNDDGKQGRTLSLPEPDRKSTRLNSSHLGISYAV